MRYFVVSSLVVIDENVDRYQRRQSCKATTDIHGMPAKNTPNVPSIVPPKLKLYQEPLSSRSLLGMIKNWS